MNSGNSRKDASSSQVKYFKAKDGKNNLLLLPTPFTGDPFLEWGTHKNLLDKPYMDIACTKHNKNEECLICDVVEDLKRQNWKGNFNIWKPLELKLRYFSPIIDLDNVQDGVQWWGYGKSVLTQFQAWLMNLEDDEKAFYETDSPSKIIVNYNSGAAAADMYKLDKKPLKAFDIATNEKWAESIKPLHEIFRINKTQEEIAECLDRYMQRMKNELADIDAHSTEDDGSKPSISKSKLDKLKN